MYFISALTVCPHPWFLLFASREDGARAPFSGHVLVGEENGSSPHPVVHHACLLRITAPPSPQTIPQLPAAYLLVIPVPQLKFRQPYHIGGIRISFQLITAVLFYGYRTTLSFWYKFCTIFLAEKHHWSKGGVLKVKVLFQQSSLLMSETKCKFTSRFEMWMQWFAAIEDLDLVFIFKS